MAPPARPLVAVTSTLRTSQSFCTAGLLLVVDL